MEYRVELINVYKRYRKNLGQAKNVLGYLLNIPSADDFWALENVSLTVKPGEILGIIGKNGAGKSTILKILAQVTQPNAGEIIVKGKIGALIEIGAGLNPELTGIENIYLYGAIVGMRRREIDKKFNAIVEFSGLTDFLNTPVKFYSSGMFLRLGFSITVHTNPEILLVDEILAVGDHTFQSSCLKKIEEIKNNGTAIIFISHNLSLVRNLCDRSLLLDRGVIIDDGPSGEVVNRYWKTFKSEQVNQYIRYGIGKVKIEAVEISHADVNRTNEMSGGQALKIRVRYASPTHPLPWLNIGVGIYKSLDNTYLANMNTQLDGYRWNPTSKHIDLIIDGVNLLEGEYYVNVVAFKDTEALPYDFWGRAATFQIIRPGKYRGLITFDHKWE